MSKAMTSTPFMFLSFFDIGRRRLFSGENYRTVVSENMLYLLTNNVIYVYRDKSISEVFFQDSGETNPTGTVLFLVADLLIFRPAIFRCLTLCPAIPSPAQIYSDVATYVLYMIYDA